MEKKGHLQDWQQLAAAAAMAVSCVVWFNAELARRDARLAEMEARLRAWEVKMEYIADEIRNLRGDVKDLAYHLRGDAAGAGRPRAGGEQGQAH